MYKISSLLEEIKHRHWELPGGKWQYYQEWNDALFLHFEVELNFFKNLIPKKLNIDHFNGKYYVSLVAFKMQNIRPRNLPAVKFISDFYEINVRTYIDNDNKKGVYFINIEAEKLLSTFIAKTLSGLPYGKSKIKRKQTGYSNYNAQKQLHLKADFEVLDQVSEKTDFDKWITERYCLYLDKSERILRYDIHHKEWDLKEIKLNSLELNYSFDQLILSNHNLKSHHYSPGVKVVSWDSTEVLL
ncbi:YqjF family protein [Pedobacter sp.]|uniref:YqjF family protein n=1 Tax=Pedobacter sp. TaxID=1411316 RepID=UPI003567B84B